MSDQRWGQGVHTSVDKFAVDGRPGAEWTTPGEGLLLKIRTDKGYEGWLVTSRNGQSYTFGPEASGIPHSEVAECLALA